MSRDAEGEQLPAIMAKDNQAIEQLEADRRNHEDVDRRNGRGVILQDRQLCGAAGEDRSRWPQDFCLCLR